MRPLTLGMMTMCLFSITVVSHAAGDTKVDESGLRYFVGAGQTERAQAEIRRLQMLHPDWKVPERIFEVRPASQDESSFWALFSAGQFEEAARAIEARRVQQAGYQPSSELQEKLNAAVLRKRVVALAKTGNWSAIAALAPQEPLGDSVDLEIRWSVAEALARDSQAQRAQSNYQAILTTLSDPALRLATIQKALTCLKVDEVEAIIPPDARGAPIVQELVRARIAEQVRTAQGEPPAQEELARFTEQAKQDRSGRDLALLGWYHLRKSNPTEASEHFRKALERDQNAVTAHGLALTLLDLGRVTEAEDMAFTWRLGTVNNLVLYLDIVERRLTTPSSAEVEPERLSRFGTVTMEAASGEGAQALGWYAYNRCRFDVAREWFELGMAWKPRETTAQGYALAMMRDNRRKTALDIINRYDGLFPKVVALLFPDGRAATNACDAPAPTVAAASRFMAIPSPTQPRGQAVAKPTEYPVAVAPQNDLRFPRQDLAAARASTYAQEPATGPWPRGTRAVAGVAAMPYRGASSIPSPWMAAQDVRRP